MTRIRFATMCLLILPVLVSARQLAAQDPAADNPLKNREKKNRSAALKQFGGTKKTERAVADGLEWLADHQRRDGVWDRKTFDQCCPADDRCTQTAIADLHREADVGVSAMAALAFLGAGYTHENGPYGEHLSRVFSYILAQQSRDGSFSAGSSYQNYNDAIAAIAIAESYILTKDPILRRPLERVIDKLVSCQQREGGWDLTDDISTGRNDSSVSSWVLMAFKSARAAGVEVPLDTRMKLLAHYDHATLANGRVWHANKRERDLDKPANPRELDIADRGYGPGSTATGLYARAAFGLRLDDPLAEKQVDLLLAELPSLKDRIRPATTAWHNEYYWYYGTMAMFNVGGEPWRRWNEALRTTILEQQERPVTPKGKHRHSFGSWPAFGPGWGEWGRSGGRIYATAINVLTLEIYYRYIPAYLSPQGLIGPIELRALKESVSPRDHGHVLKLATRLHPDTGEPILIELLESPNPDARLNAALALTEYASPLGRGTLLAERDGAMGDKRALIERALGRIPEKPKPRQYGRVTAINSQAKMILFDKAGQWIYYEQPLRVLRDGKTIAMVRVKRRFSPQDAGAAAIESEEAEIIIGDQVATSEE